MTVEEPLQRQLDQSHDSDKPTKIDTSFLREPSGNLSSAGTTPPLSSNSSQVTTNSTSSMHKLKDDSYVKKNIDLHLLFKSLPIDDFYITDYVCALQKDIMVQGKIYISDHHFGFFSNILGYITNILIPISEITLIEKKNAALIFPNAILIKHGEIEYFFLSFLSRDEVFEIMESLWKDHQPKNEPSDEFNNIDVFPRNIKAEGHSTPTSDADSMTNKTAPMPGKRKQIRTGSPRRNHSKRNSSPIEVREPTKAFYFKLRLPEAALLGFLLLSIVMVVITWKALLEVSSHLASLESKLGELSSS